MSKIVGIDYENGERVAMYVQTEDGVSKFVPERHAECIMHDTYERLIKMAVVICCPICNKEKCVGRYKCAEISHWIDKKLEMESIIRRMSNEKLHR